MPKAKVEEQEVPVEEAVEEAPEPVPETPKEEIVEPKVTKSRKKPESAPQPKKKASTNLKQRHTCGACGAEMSLHTALYGHKNCPGEVSVPQPPALVRQPAPEPEVPQFTHAQLLRMQLAQAAQERRAQAQLRMTAPIRHFYGMA